MLRKADEEVKALVKDAETSIEIAEPILPGKMRDQLTRANPFQTCGGSGALDW